MASKGYGTQRAAPAAQKEVNNASPPLRHDPSLPGADMAAAATLQLAARFVAEI